MSQIKNSTEENFVRKILFYMSTLLLIVHFFTLSQNVKMLWASSFWLKHRGANLKLFRSVWYRKWWEWMVRMRVLAVTHTLHLSPKDVQHLSHCAWSKKEQGGSQYPTGRRAREFTYLAPHFRTAILFSITRLFLCKIFQMNELKACGERISLEPQP